MSALSYKHVLSLCITPFRYERRKAIQAFTLLELMVGIGMLALLSAALFALTSSLLLGISESTVHIRRGQQIESCVLLLRGSFRRLSSSTWIKSLDQNNLNILRPSFSKTTRSILASGRIRGIPLLIAGEAKLYSWQTTRSIQEESITPLQKTSSPDNFQSNNRINAFSEVPLHVLIAIAEADGTITLCAIRPGWSRPIPLLDNLVAVKWRFLDPKATDWTDTWMQAAKPSLVELTITLAEDPSKPFRSIFWIATQPSPRR